MKRRSLILGILFLVTTLVARGEPWACAEVACIDHLLGLIQERLALAEPVARAKWNSGAPIEDRQREQQIIEGLGRQAQDYGVDQGQAEVFFRAQIEASKMAQRALHRHWKAESAPPFAQVADLGGEIRPALDRLTPLLLEALREARPALRRQDGAALVRARVDAPRMSI